MRTLTLARLLGLLLLTAATPALAQAPDPNKTYSEEEVDPIPQFQGGAAAMRLFLEQKTITPQFALTNKFGGTVDVEFILMPDGRFDSLHVANPVCCGMDEEALRVVRLMEGKWVAGRLKGQPVRTRVEVNVPFKVAYQTNISLKRLAEVRKSFDAYRQTPAYEKDQEAYRAAIQTHQ